MGVGSELQELVLAFSGGCSRTSAPFVNGRQNAKEEEPILRSYYVFVRLVRTLH